MKQDSSNLDGARETRRSFIRKSSIAAAAVASAANIFKTPVYGQSQAPSTGRVIGANDRIVVGYIGVGGQGMAHVKTQKQDATANNIAQVAVCDVSKFRQNHAKQAIGGDVAMYDDYRKLLENKDIDAVTIATVDHWHTKTSIAAMEAGKHVYCEKPMTRYLGEAFDFHDAVKRTGKIFQLGSQGCSAAGWHRAAEMIQAGKIGQMVWAQGFYCRNTPDGEWNYPIQQWCTAADTNWEAWQGPVKKKTAFSADSYFRWRKYYPYCAGLLGDLVPHRLNPLMLATGNPEYPKRVVSIGTKSVGSDKLKKDGTPTRDVPEHVEILAEFPSGVLLSIICSTVAAKSPGFVIYGHKASLDIGSSGESIQVTVEQPFAEGGKFEDATLENQTIKGLTPTENINAHEKNWFECIRTNNPKTNANIDLATKAQTVISLAEMSQRLNMACMFDEKTRKVTTENGKAVKPITYGTLELS